MGEALRQFVIGAGSILLTPLGSVPTEPDYRISVFSRDARREIGGDMARVSSDMARAVEQEENSKQLDLELGA